MINKSIKVLLNYCAIKTIMMKLFLQNSYSKYNSPLVDSCARNVFPLCATCRRDQCNFFPLSMPESAGHFRSSKPGREFASRVNSKRRHPTSMSTTFWTNISPPSWTTRLQTKTSFTIMGNFSCFTPKYFVVNVTCHLRIKFQLGHSG